MNFNITKVKLEVSVPQNNVEDVRNSIFIEDAGIIGNYSHCSISTQCISTFMPNNNAKPYIGEINKLEYVFEEKLEILCDINKVKQVIKKIKEVHPYEEPVINIIPLINEYDLFNIL